MADHSSAFSVNQPIVIDNGSGNLKAGTCPRPSSTRPAAAHATRTTPLGFAGSDHPSTFFPSYVGTSRPRAGAGATRS